MFEGIIFNLKQIRRVFFFFLRMMLVELSFAFSPVFCLLGVWLYVLTIHVI